MAKALYVRVYNSVNMEPWSFAKAYRRWMWSLALSLAGKGVTKVNL